MPVDSSYGVVPVLPGDAHLLWIDDQLFTGSDASDRWSPTGIVRPSVRLSAGVGGDVAVLHGPPGRLALEVVEIS